MTKKNNHNDNDITTYKYNAKLHVLVAISKYNICGYAYGRQLASHPPPPFFLRVHFLCVFFRLITVDLFRFSYQKQAKQRAQKQTAEFRACVSRHSTTDWCSVLCIFFYYSQQDTYTKIVPQSYMYTKHCKRRIGEKSTTTLNFLLLFQLPCSEYII